MTIKNKAYNDLLIPASNALADIEMNGIAVDKELLKEKEKEYKEELEERREEMEKFLKERGWSTERYFTETTAKSRIDEFNPNSDPQVHYVCFEILNLPKYRGNKSADTNARTYWIEEHNSEFAEMLEEYKNLYTTFSRYLRGMWKYIDNDGRIRGNFKLHGTCTGRLSCENPNLQQMQHEIRDIFIPEDGNVMLEADFSQAELRCLAVFSQDVFMKEVYKNGEDLHDQATERIYGEGWTDKQRKTTKNGHFGLIYGAGANKLHETTGMSKDEAKEWINDWKAMCPSAWEWLERQPQKVKEQGYIETPFERRRRFPLILNKNLSDVVNESKNAPVQGTASDLLLKSCIELQDDNRFDQLALVHDSILFEIPEEIHKEVTSYIIDIMEKTAQELMNADIPFVADAELSHSSWGDMKEISKDDKGNLQFEEVDY